MVNCTAFTRLRLSVLAVMTLLQATAFTQAPEVAREVNLLINDRADSAVVNRLMKMGESVLEKKARAKDDMASVVFIAGRMESLGSRLKDSAAFGLAQLLLAKTYRVFSKQPEGRAASLNAVRLLNLYGNTEQKAEAFIELGGSYSNNAQDIAIKVFLYKQAASLYRQKNLKLEEARIREFIGDLLQIDNKFDSSLAELNTALQLYQSVGYKRLHGIYSIMAMNYSGLNKYTESLKYNLLAMNTGEQAGDRTNLMEAIYNRVGINYYNVRYYDQALGYFRKALVLAKENAETATIKNMLINIADGLTNIKQYNASLDTLTAALQYPPAEDAFEKVMIAMLFIKNYICLEKPAEAEPYFGKLQQYYQDAVFSEHDRQLMRSSFISYLQAIGRFREAERYISEYQHHMKNAPLTLRKVTEVEWYAFRSDSALGRFISAIEHFRLYKLYSDSLTNTAQAKQMAMLQLQFETEQKDKNIELLTQKNQLQEASLQKEKIFRNVFIAGVGMLLVFCALLYNRYRLKKKAALTLERQQNKINEQNKMLTRLVEDKEWLLKEIHHRVKNNLQIVISLLNTQSKYLNNEDAVAAIRNSQHRMHAMSLIHQRLYQTSNLGAIDMNWYINELIRYMKDAFETEGNITFNANIEPVCLDVIQAVPLGLILNEAVSNSIKYAFPGGKKGLITIELKGSPDGSCELWIRDNGIGFANNETYSKPDSLGMSLMQGLSDQLEGEFSLESSNEGVLIRLVFQCRQMENKTTSEE